ncbi:MAG TPA: phage protease [Opitutaceae bacterium]|nr:phage protease [Opitutaceae bacterium]HRJ48139.1 phage protease [Opitutaceae bacterium]
MICIFRAPTSIDAGTELPKRLLMAKWGRNESVKGPVIVNELTARAVPRLQALAGYQEIALDFQHNTVEGSPAFKAEREPRKVAAFGSPEVVPGEGIYFNVARWTPEGEEAVKNGHYPDISPAVKFENDAESGVVIFCHSCAVCRQGAIDGLHVYGADDPARLKQAVATFTAELAGNKTTPMDHKKLLCLLLGLDPATATDEAITAAAKAKTKAATGDQPAAEVKTLAADIQSLKTLIEGQNKRLDSAERENITLRAISQGKVIPHSASELPIDQFKKIVDELPANVVPMDKRTVEGVKTFAAASTTPAANSYEQEVQRQLRIKPETWQKHNAA